MLRLQAARTVSAVVVDPHSHAATLIRPLTDSGVTVTQPSTGPVAVGDFNGDGDPDVAVANEFAGSVSVLLGSTGGTFTGPTNFPAGSSPPRSRWASSTATATPTSRSPIR